MRRLSTALPIGRRRSLLDAVTVTSWFHSPEIFGDDEARDACFDGKGYDVLCRASGTVVSPMVEHGSAADVRIATCLHVVRPFLYPHLYGDAAPWLHHVRESDIIVTIEIRDDITGEVMRAARLAPDAVLAHNDRDLALLPLNYHPNGNVEHLDADAFERARAHLVRVHAISEEDIDHHRMPNPNDAVLLGGHNLLPRFDPVTGNDTSPQVPHAANGVVIGTFDGVLQRSRSRSSSKAATVHEKDEYFPVRQMYVRTPSETLQRGMCGGPVVAGADSSFRFAGITEGIVIGSKNSLVEENAAAVVPADLVARMVLNDFH